jgi:hypothetical protein
MAAPPAACTTHRKMAAVALLLATVSSCVSMATACVPPDCVYRVQMSSGTTLSNPWLVFAIILACIFFVVILLILIWLCCFCWYRNDTDQAPTIVRRIILIRHKRPAPPPQRKKQLRVIAPPPATPTPVHPYQPSEKVVVVTPCVAPTRPESLIVTVNSPTVSAAATGPAMTTLVERPLTFTITPEYGRCQGNNRLNDITSRYRDVTYNNGSMVPTQHSHVACNAKCRHPH